MNRFTVVILSSLVLVGTSAKLFAEAERGLFLDFAGGIAGTNETTQDITSPAFPEFTLSSKSKVDGTSSFGGKIGYYFSSIWGAGLDIFSYSTNGGDTKVPITALGFSLLARWPGESFQPYIGISPTIYFNKVQMSGGELTGTNFGFSLPLGAKYIFWKQEKVSLGALAEYKLSYNPASTKGNITMGGTALATEAKATLVSHHILFGLSLGFAIP